ncbi:hypothetical protein J4474_04140 [Candidatus Pacearchaeota archaeon]|nr:hypothetical protein [Candidatus Pacearchaeota archaeon]
MEFKKLFFLFAFFLVLLINFVLAENCSIVGEVNGTKYCAEDGKYYLLRIDGADCLNDYECEVGSCSEGVCGDQYSQLVDQGTEIKHLWELLSGENCDNIYDKEYMCEGTTAFLCGANNVWENKGNIEGVCGYTSGGGTNHGSNSDGSSNVGGGGSGFAPRTPQQVHEDLEPESYCGDGVCDFSESSATCSEDCPAEKKSMSWQRIVAWIILIAVIVGLIAVGIIFLMRRKKNNKEENSPMNNPVLMDMPSEQE